jgi:hypothetical protein
MPNSPGEMDDGLANTIYNLNQMIATANNTIGLLADGASNQANMVSAKNTLAEKTACIQKGKYSCDKDAFDVAFATYIELQDCSTHTGLKKRDATNCDATKVFEDIYTKDGEALKLEVHKKLTNEINILNDMLSVANEQMKYYNHLDDLDEKYTDASKTLEKKVGRAVSRLKTENRRTFYENQQMDLLSHVTKFLTFFYWLCVLAWVIVILYRTKYTIPSNLLLTAGFIAFPFVVDIIIVWTFQIVIAIYDTLPTDAYLDMRRGS